MGGEQNCWLENRVIIPPWKKYAGTAVACIYAVRISHTTLFVKFLEMFTTTHFSQKTARIFPI